jgi:CHAT domain-containing protein/tetratricopeptide (TPR) repeat protein
MLSAGVIAKARTLAAGLLLAALPVRSDQPGNETREGSSPAAGVVVETVAPQSPAERVGLRSGDVIVSWSCAAAGGSIRSPYDLLPLEIEEAPRRAVTLRGQRSNQEMTWTLTAGEWGLESRPILPAGLTDLAAAERSWQSAVDSAQAAGDGRLAAWLLHRLARAFAAAGKWPEADAAYGKALAILEQASDNTAAADLIRGWGKTFERRGAWDAAVERYQQALAIDRKQEPKSLSIARTLNALGVATAKRGDYAGADDLLRQALAIREELAPGTVEVTGSLTNLGILARHRGDLAAAEAYLARGEELQRRIAPDSSDRALFFQNLGNVAMDRGDLQKAEGFHRQALAIFEKTAPGGDGVTDCLSNLASIATLRGDLVAADDFLQRSLALQERKARDEADVWGTLTLLGNLAERRGDLEAAEHYYRRALKLQEKLSPEGPEVAFSLGNLGLLAIEQGGFATARTCLRRALAIREKLAPGSLDVANILEHLGRLETQSPGDLASAEKLFRRAQAIFDKEAPESLEAADIMRDLGEVAARRGRLADALTLFRRALDLQGKLAPGTTGEAEALYSLGRAERRAGRSQEATRDFCRAIDVLDRQRARLGGTPEARTSFEASIVDYYYACMEGLLQLGQPAAAFHVVERSRARSFLALLAERDLRLSDLPPELAAERRHADAEYDRVQSQLARLSPGRDDAEIERLTGELHDLRTRQEEIIARKRRESPRSAALENPEPLELSGTRAALEPGTALLEYAVGPQRSWLFVVQPGEAGHGLSVFPIAAGAKSLRGEVESFRRLLKRPGTERAKLQAGARHLYDLLVHPAEGRISGSRRILISPDGPLHVLPFAALSRQDGYLVEWKPIHYVISATVYAELARSRPAPRDPATEVLAAFGDPVYPPPAADVAADPEVGEAVRRGLALKPLPATRAEVEEIAALYPRAEVFLGRQATEERAKAIGGEPRLVHFACHGILDERFPLNSALVLSLPERRAEGQENGLLQAWEIFESVRLDADLVTLSACDTALGREMGGEGLVGLTRAFQYAGARSVLASLWSVSDRSTARFMKGFYTYLRGGKPKAEALRAAQIDQIRRRSHPFHWAAFELFGDSR